MISIIYFTILFAIAYAIKGGQSDDVLRNWNRQRAKSKFWDRLLDGKVLSTLIVLIGLSVYTVVMQVNLGVMPYAWQSVILVTGGWLLAVAPSMGEEYAAIMDSDTNNPYKEHFDREYGIKKAIQRGVWMGAIMALVIGFTGFILASFMFVPLSWLAFNYMTKIKPLDAWGWSEVLIGAICFGLPMGLHVSGV